MSESSSISVSTLWRYPVKSMLGEELNSSGITTLGILGDRAFALVDVETGQVVSAKNPKKWPDFFAYRAAYATPPEDGTMPAVWITLPSGKIVRSDQADVDAVLSAALSRSVSLQVSAPESPVLEEYCPDNEGKDNEVIRAAMAGDAPVGTFFRLFHPAYFDNQYHRSIARIVSAGPLRGQALPPERGDRHHRPGRFRRKRLGRQNHTHRRVSPGTHHRPLPALRHAHTRPGRFAERQRHFQQGHSAKPGACAIRRQGAPEHWRVRQSDVHWLGPSRGFGHHRIALAYRMRRLVAAFHGSTS